MFSKILFLFLLAKIVVAEGVDDFTCQGFLNANLSLNGVAEITDDGLLRLTNKRRQEIGRAFYSVPLQWKNTSNGNVFSFSTMFVFAMITQGTGLMGHGIAFVISPSEDFRGALPSAYLGLFNSTSDGDPSNHVFAVELDTVRSPEFSDIDDNHVGIDINGLHSGKRSASAGFTDENGDFQSLILSNGHKMNLWIEYDGHQKQLNVTLSPFHLPKPSLPLLSSFIDLSSVIQDSMYVGFSSSTGSTNTSHYILGWSFKMNGQAQPLDLSSLPSIPKTESSELKKWILRAGLPIVSVLLVTIIVSTIIFAVRRRNKFAEVLEDWELQYGPHRFFYRDLYEATKGFKEEELLGIGGFGMVYKGILPNSKIEVAVKRISQDSRQGTREFVAEIASIGRIRHPNLARLLGYCRRKNELLLVYDFMPNGSLDNFLYDKSHPLLNWNQRFQIIKDVALGLLYLHEEWLQVVLHRDIKASNVLLDHDMNGKLGDFGLARLYDHGTDPHTTRMVGTLGYLAPEMTRTGRATTSSDVFAFGAFVLEVACGRRPMEAQASIDEVILVDWVQECERKGAILEVADAKLGTEFVAEEMILVLRLGLLCSHPVPAARPSMRQVVQFLEYKVLLPVETLKSASVSIQDQDQGFETIVASYPSSASDSLLSQ